MRLFFLAFLVGQCFSQSLTFGVKGTLRATDDVEGYASSESKLYSVGPGIEVGLPHRFSFEFDALYHRFGYSYTSYGLLGEVSFGRSRANVWNFRCWSSTGCPRARSRHMCSPVTLLAA